MRTIGQDKKVNKNMCRKFNHRNDSPSRIAINNQLRQRHLSFFKSIVELCDFNWFAKGEIAQIFVYSGMKKKVFSVTVKRPNWSKSICVLSINFHVTVVRFDSYLILLNVVILNVPWFIQRIFLTITKYQIGSYFCYLF